MVRRRPGQLLSLELDILDNGSALQAAEGSFYGFRLAKSLAESNDSALTAHGTLYKALGRLSVAGLLEASWEDPATAEAEGRPRRRLYRVTAEGELARAEQHRRLAAERAAAANPVAAATVRPA